MLQPLDKTDGIWYNYCAECYICALLQDFQNNNEELIYHSQDANLQKNLRGIE
jgi:hypothetical protein